MIQTEGRMIAVQNKGKTIRKIFNYFQVKPFHSEYGQNAYQFKSCCQYCTFVTEIIQPYDHRELVTSAVENEIKGLVNKKKWKIVCRSEVTKNAIILEGRLVSAIKDCGFNKKTY